ncbi:MAG: phosphotransferase [Cyanobacteria bacterium P01_F01_bin.150]
MWSTLQYVLSKIGDVHPTNLLVRDGCLSAVIDFGCLGVGDPACDFTIAWTFFSGRSRAAFRDAVGVDDSTWSRSRGWTLWKALITLAKNIDVQPLVAETARHTVAEVMADSHQDC